MLSRVALRLAAVEALSPSALAQTGPWPTIAGPRVYDSRQDPIDGLDNIESKPLLVVYTEQTEETPYPHGKSKPDDIQVMLVIEALIAARGLVTIDLPDGSQTEVGSVEMPVTERNHEAMLDLLESTVRRRLEGRVDVDTWTQLFRKVAWEIQHVESLPMRDSSRSVRLAGRTIIFKVKVPTDNWPDPTTSASTATGFDRLPEPIKTVAKAVPSTSSAAEVCTKLVSMLPNLTVLTPLGSGIPADGRGSIAIADFVDRTSTSGTADITTAVSP